MGWFPCRGCGLFTGSLPLVGHRGDEVFQVWKFGELRDHADAGCEDEILRNPLIQPALNLVAEPVCFERIMRKSFACKDFRCDFEAQFDRVGFARARSLSILESGLWLLSIRVRWG